MFGLVQMFSQPELVGLRAVSDGLTAASCLLIFLALTVFIGGRGKGRQAQSLDLRFSALFAIFSIFLLACGATKIMEIWTLWHSAHVWLTIFEAVTAVASVALSITLIIGLAKAEIVSVPFKASADGEPENLPTEISLASHISRIEEERYGISRVLHDEVGQSLIAVKLKMHGLAIRLPENSPELKEELSGLRQLANVSIGLVSDLDRRLRPPVFGESGLRRAIERLAADQQKRNHLTVSLEIEALPRLVEASEIAIYRIVQEGFTNIVKHAHATQVRLCLRCSDTDVELSLRDDGEGFDPDAGGQGLGIPGIRDRVAMMKGHFDVTTKRYEGTTISIRLPVGFNSPTGETKQILNSTGKTAKGAHAL